MRVSSTVAALCLLAVPGEVAGGGHRLKAHKTRGTLAKETGRLQRLVKHAKAYDQQPLEFQGVGVSKAQGGTGETTVEATYGVVPIYDFVVDVDIEDTHGEKRSVPVIMDTGSSNLAIATDICSNCDEGATKIDLALSKPVYCMEVTYGSGSWDGVLASKDVKIGLGDVSGSAPYALTAIYSQDDFFDGGYSGILGLSYTTLAGDYTSCSMDFEEIGDASTTTGPSSSSSEDEEEAGGGASDNWPPVTMNKSPSGGVGSSSGGMGSSSSSITGHTLLHSWAKEGVIDKNLLEITYCEEDALLTVGKVDETLYDGAMTYVDIQKTYGLFYAYFLVYVAEVTFDDEEVDLSDANINEYGGVLVDSGTTLMYLPSEVTKQIKASLEESCDECDDSFFEWDTCIDKSTADDLPDLTITFSNGVDADDTTTYTMVFPAERYLYNLDGCLYWGMGSSSLGIVGNIAQEGHTIVFDTEENKMGFATADCSSISSSSSLSAAGSVASMTGFYLGLVVLAGFLVVAAVFAVVRTRRSNAHAYTAVAGDEFVI